MLLTDGLTFSLLSRIWRECLVFILQTTLLRTGFFYLAYLLNMSCLSLLSERGTDGRAGVAGLLLPTDERQMLGARRMPQGKRGTDLFARMGQGWPSPTKVPGRINISPSPRPVSPYSPPRSA